MNDGNNFESTYKIEDQTKIKNHNRRLLYVLFNHEI